MNNGCYNFEDFNIEIINDPKVNIDKSSIEDLILECTNLSRDSFGCLGISKELIKRHLLETSILMIGKDLLGKIIGFCSTKIVKIENFHIVYFQCVVVSNRYKKNGLYNIFIPLRIIEGVKLIKKIDSIFDKNNILIGGRTQNPVAFRVVNKLIGSFPTPNGFIDERIRHIGKSFAKSIYDDDCKHNDYVHPFDFNEETFIAKSAYKTSSNNQMNEVDLYNSNIPFSNDYNVNNYMKENINWKNGDAIISLGYYNSDKIKNLLKNSEKTILNRCVINFKKG